MDGVSRQVYVTALSVDEALAQLGYRADDLVLSASRSERLPLDGMELTITTPKEIVLVSDGQQRVVSTTAATAGDLLAEQGIALSETDKTSLYLNQGLLNRMRLQVFRVQVKRGRRDHRGCRSRRSRPPTRTPSSATRRWSTPGVAGEQVTTVPRDRRRRRRDRPQGALDQVTVAPVAEQVTVGTKARPRRRASPTASTGTRWRSARPAATGRSTPATATTAALQFSSTWRVLGRLGYPTDSLRRRSRSPSGSCSSRATAAGQRVAAGSLLLGCSDSEHSTGAARRAAGSGRDPRAGPAARPAADQDARAELPARRQHDPPDRAHGRPAARRRRPRGRAGPRLADPRAAAGGRARRRRRDRPAAGRAAAGDRGRPPPRPGRPADRGDGRRAARPGAPRDRRRPRWWPTCRTTSPSRCC